MARFPALPTPERPRGTDEQKIERLYSYIWQLVEQLNNALNLIDKEMSKNGEDRRG